MYTIYDTYSHIDHIIIDRVSYQTACLSCTYICIVFIMRFMLYNSNFTATSSSLNVPSCSQKPCIVNIYVLILSLSLIFKERKLPF